MHEIRFASDDEMPEGHDFVFAHAGESAMILYRESAITPEVLMDSWAAYRATLGRTPREPSELRDIIAQAQRGVRLADSVGIPDQRLKSAHGLAAAFHVA